MRLGHGAPQHAVGRRKRADVAADWVALLRAVNVTGHNKVSMSDLRTVAGELGLGDPRTLLQSGNLVFRGGGRDAGTLEQRLERVSRERLGLSTTYFVRAAAEWQTIIRDNPFPREAVSAPQHLVLVCLKHAVAVSAVADLRRAIVGEEAVAGEGRQIYLVYPSGIGTSKLTSALIERKLGCGGTARNWNTVLKLGALLAEA